MLERTPDDSEVQRSHSTESFVSFRGFGFVVDKFEDRADVLGGVFVWVTGLATCVNVVEDLLGKLSLKLGLRAPTGVEVLAWTREG